MEDEFNLFFRQVLNGDEISIRSGALHPAVVVFRKDSNGVFRSREHEHPFYEFIIPFRGTISCRIDGKTITASETKPCLILIPPLTPHVRFSTAGCTAYSMHLQMKQGNSGNVDNLSVFLRSLEKAEYHFPIPPEFPALLEKAEELVRNHPPLWLELARCILTELLLRFFSLVQKQFFTGSEPVPATSRQELLDRILYTVSTQTGHRLDTKKHACFIGLSERHLSRFLKEIYGMPLGKFIVHQRIESAKALLAENLNLVKDIALSLGFSDASHFCRVFRKETGMTPRQYVKHLRENAKL